MSRLTEQDIQRIMDFVAGARWWECETTGATMWQEDQNRACAAAKEYLEFQAVRAAVYAERGEKDPLLEIRQQQVIDGEFGLSLGKANDKENGAHGGLTNGS